MTLYTISCHGGSHRVAWLQPCPILALTMTEHGCTWTRTCYEGRLPVCFPQLANLSSPSSPPSVRPGAAGSRSWSKARDAFRPDALQRPWRAGAVKGGRRPGPDPRAATRSPKGEHGEHGEDLPLDRPEHRGTTQASRLLPLSTQGRSQRQASIPSLAVIARPTSQRRRHRVHNF